MLKCINNVVIVKLFFMFHLICIKILKVFIEKYFYYLSLLTNPNLKLKTFKHYGNIRTRFLKIIVNLLTNLILEAYTIMNGIIEIHNIVKHFFQK